MEDERKLKREEVIRIFGKSIDNVRVINGKKYIQTPCKWRGPAGSWHYSSEWKCIDDN